MAVIVVQFTRLRGTAVSVYLLLWKRLSPLYIPVTYTCLIVDHNTFMTCLSGREY